MSIIWGVARDDLVLICVDGRGGKSSALRWNSMFKIRLWGGRSLVCPCW